jgi:hypothetical protein
MTPVLFQAGCLLQLLLLVPQLLLLALALQLLLLVPHLLLPAPLVLPLIFSQLLSALLLLLAPAPLAMPPTQTWPFKSTRNQAIQPLNSDSKADLIAFSILSHVLVLFLEIQLELKPQVL